MAAETQRDSDWRQKAGDVSRTVAGWWGLGWPPLAMVVIGVPLAAAIWALFAALGGGTWYFWDWNAQSSVAVATGVTGYFLAFFAAMTYARGKAERQATTLRELLRDGLEIYALPEAWILEGEGWEAQQPLSHHANPLPALGLGATPKSEYLLTVEVRAVLDQCAWNLPDGQSSPPFYRVFNGRRAWVVRDRVTGEMSYGNRAAAPDAEMARPGLLSSRALHELAGWIERVAAADREGLPRNGLEALRPLLVAVAGTDRTKALAKWLTPEAHGFLERYRAKHPEEFLQAGGQRTADG